MFRSVFVPLKFAPYIQIGHIQCLYQSTLMVKWRAFSRPFFSIFFSFSFAHQILLIYYSIFSILLFLLFSAQSSQLFKLDIARVHCSEDDSIKISDNNMVTDNNVMTHRWRRKRQHSLWNIVWVRIGCSWYSRRRHAQTHISFLAKRKSARHWKTQTMKIINWI